MAQDGLFFRGSGKIHDRYRTPAHSLVMQCIWTCVLCISGSYGQLLDYIIFAVLMFYILTIGGLIVLRIKRPDQHRPYRTIGYPVLPVIYILMAIYIDGILLLYKPHSVDASEAGNKNGNRHDDGARGADDLLNYRGCHSVVGSILNAAGKNRSAVRISRQWKHCQVYEVCQHIKKNDHARANCE
jgi:amino acid transporter